MTRARRAHRAVLLALGLVLAVALPAHAITAEEKARLDKGAQETINEMNSLLKEVTTDDRKTCALGGGPGRVAQIRANEPAIQSLEASGMCVSLLKAQAKDGRLGELYRDLLTRLGGDVAGAARWPRAIGAAVLADRQTVAIGNDKAIRVKPALAFDAGFTVAYQEGSASQEQEADAVQLQALAEACLAQRQDAGACFSAGYLYGAAGVRGKNLLAR